MSLSKKKSLLDRYPAPSLIFELNNLKIKAANDAALSLYEYSLDEMLSLTIKSLRPPDEVPKMMNFFSERFKGDDIVGVWKHQTKKGRHIYVNILSKTIQLEGKVNVIASMNDVTEYKHLEKRYHNTKSYLELFKNKLPEMYYILDSEGGFLEWNQRTLTLTEYSGNEISKMNIINIFHPIEQIKFSDVLEKVLETGHGKIETTLLSKYKKQIHVTFNAQKILTAGDKQIFGSFVLKPDNIETDVHRIQQQKLLQTIIDQANSVIYIKDVEGRFRFVNSKFLDLFNLSTADVIGKKNTDLLKLENAHQIILNDEIVRSTGKPLQFEEKAHIEGEIKTFLSTKMLISGIDRYENWLFGTSTDITDRVKTEALLGEYLRENEVLLKEIHHRVKNNLAVITGLVELQVMDCHDSEYETKMRDIQSRIKSIALTHELLYQKDYFSQIDFHENVTKISDNIACSFNSEVKFKHRIEPVVININQALPCSLMLNEIITNSIKHAFDKTEKPTIVINLSETNGHIMLSVSDNGCGLPENLNLENPSTLGFTLIMILKDQLNANLEIKSDQGTTIKLTFKRSNIRGVGSSIV